MRRIREYQKATELDMNSLQVNLHGIADTSSVNETRSLEVIDHAVKMIELASKRGRAQLNEGEVCYEAA